MVGMVPYHRYMGGMTLQATKKNHHHTIVKPRCTRTHDRHITATTRENFFCYAPHFFSFAASAKTLNIVCLATRFYLLETIQKA